MKKDIILAIDTTCEELFLSLVINGAETRVHITDCNSKHSLLLLPEIDKLLKNQNVTINDVNIFALSAGPGSFTGIRIGVSTVKGFIFGNNKQVILVNSLEANAYTQLKEGQIVLSLIDAKRDNCYVGVYTLDKGNIKEVFAGFSNKEKLQELVCEKTILSSPYNNNFNVAVNENYYDSFMKLVLDRAEKNQFSTETFAPLYLKKSQAEEEADGVS